MDTTSISGPFRFLDLPLELQRNILAKTLEDPWSITASVRSWKHDPDAPDHVTTPILRYTSSHNLSINPLLVSHHFHQEAKLAMVESRGNTYIDDEADDDNAGFCLPNFFDAAITTMRTKQLYCDHTTIARYKAQFPNLHTLQLGVVSQYYVKESRRLVHKTTMNQLCKGEIDEQLREILRGDLMSTFGKTAWLEFCGVAVVFSTDFSRLATHWSDEVPEGHTISDHVLRISITVHEDYCTMKKWFHPGYGSNSNLICEATQDNLIRWIAVEKGTGETVETQ